MRSGMTYEPTWPVPPVTKTSMLLALLSSVIRNVLVRLRSTYGPCWSFRLQKAS